MNSVPMENLDSSSFFLTHASISTTLTPTIQPSLASTIQSYVEFVWKSYADVMGTRNLSCAYNCSGHGECHNGTCLCEVEFDGDTCTYPNMAYYIAFATIFYTICVVSIAQLVICIRSEFQRMKTPSLWRACRITTQKLLYFLVFLACAIRGVYFSAPDNAWVQKSGLLSAYYAVLLSGASLIVCFWAEVFHLHDIRWDKPRFLSKSFVGFVTFNVIIYSVLVTELLLTHYSYIEEDYKSYLVQVFNACYAFLMFVVVIFFLIYGVEVYFKVRGGFLSDSYYIGDRDDEQSKEPGVASRLMFDQIRGGFSTGPVQTIDTNQLHQSRFGLVAQACMLLITVCFLFFELLSEVWDYKVSLTSRNTHNIVFRVVEMGVALWFPCVLWNCIRPEQLWILNPKKILKKLDLDLTEKRSVITKEKDLSEDGSEKSAECWICYDTEREDTGPMIQPCNCKGDVGAVHHDCLRKWLVESSDNPGSLQCKVCNTPYMLEQGQAWIGNGLTVKQWFHTAGLVSVMCVSAAGGWAVVQIYSSTITRLLAVSITVLIQYICLRFLGFSAVTAYQRARVSAVQILGKRLGVQAANGNVSTISDRVIVSRTELTNIPETPL